jgi:transcriptional repressor NrdR
MRCPKCSCLDDKVLETRMDSDGTTIRRRRECLECGFRFTSYEHIKEKIVKVVKKDGRREDFNRKKLFVGITKAVEKRPVSQEDVERMVDNIEERVIAIATETGALEIKSHQIGEIVMDVLQKTDKISFIRFASVYIDEEEIFKQKIKEVLNS